MRIKRRVCAKYASYAKAMCSSIEFSADQGCLGKQKIRGAVHHKQHLCTQQYIIIIIWRWLKHINTDDIHSSIPRVLQKLKKKSLLSVQVQLKFAKQNNNGREEKYCTETGDIWQSQKKQKLSGQQDFSLKNFPDKARKTRHFCFCNKSA